MAAPHVITHFLNSPPLSLPSSHTLVSRAPYRKKAIALWFHFDDYQRRIRSSVGAGYKRKKQKNFAALITLSLVLLKASRVAQQFPLPLTARAQSESESVNGLRRRGERGSFGVCGQAKEWERGESFVPLYYTQPTTHTGWILSPSFYAIGVW